MGSQPKYHESFRCNPPRPPGVRSPRAQLDCTCAGRPPNNKNAPAFLHGASRAPHPRAYLRLCPQAEAAAFIEASPIRCARSAVAHKISARSTTARPAADRVGFPAARFLWRGQYETGRNPKSCPVSDRPASFAGIAVRHSDLPRRYTGVGYAPYPQHSAALHICTHAFAQARTKASDAVASVPSLIKTKTK